MNENPNNFNEFEQEKGNISGFDSVKESGATEDNLYSKNKSEIIQDDIFSSTPNSSNEEKTSNNPYPQNHWQPNDYNFNKQVMPKSTKRKYGLGVVILAALLAAVVGAVSSLAVVFVVKDNIGIFIDDEAQIPNSANVNINIDKSVESVVEAVAEKVSPSVVGIRTTTSVMSFFGGSSESTGEGSGVIYTSDGYIITNYHVIQAVVESRTNSKIEVFLNGDTENSYEAKVIGYHISSDLALIKIDAKNLKAVEIAEKDNLKVGQYVVAIGNPGGLEFMGSVTYGVISGLNRVISSEGIELIQTDAAINPGNSGGALLNTSGQLIGINSSKIVAQEYEGMGFAIPLKTVIDKCDKIIERKDKPEPYIGITISEKYTPDVLKYYDFPVGAVVLNVDDNSPADEIGIKRGDIITEFNGKEITNYKLFEEYLSDCEVDSTVNIKIYRSGQHYNAKIKVTSNTFYN